MAKKMTYAKWRKHLSKEAHYAAFDELVDHLRNHIDTHGVSVARLALDCDVSQGTIHNWLSYSVMFPHFKTIAKIAQGLGLQITFKEIVQFRKAA